MTNYINEMMKTAGIIKIYDRECEHKLQKYCDENACYDPYFHPYPLCVGYENCTQKYKKRIEYYPDFTAGKQLTLEDLIIKEVGYIRIDYTKEIQDKIPQAYQYNIFGGSYEVHSKNYVASTRAETLAQLTTELMNAGELDKKKVKEILEA